jgi:hypothetical protein
MEIFFFRDPPLLPFSPCLPVHNPIAPPLQWGLFYWSGVNPNYALPFSSVTGLNNLHAGLIHVDYRMIFFFSLEKIIKSATVRQRNGNFYSRAMVILCVADDSESNTCLNNRAPSSGQFYQHSL